jgi:hypothetical protein
MTARRDSRGEIQSCYDATTMSSCRPVFGPTHTLLNPSVDRASVEEHGARRWPSHHPMAPHLRIRSGHGRRQMKIGALLTISSRALALVAALCSFTTPSWALLLELTVPASAFFVSTGIFVDEDMPLLLRSTGTVNLAAFDGPYITDPDGVILEAPPPGSGGFNFFRDAALPSGVEPIPGIKKFLVEISPLFPPPHQPPLLGGPAGALVAGFSTVQDPSSYLDFPFVLVGRGGIVTPLREEDFYS